MDQDKYIYSITINQKAIVENNWVGLVKVNHIMVIESIKSMMLYWKNINRIQDENGDWYNISFQKIIDDLPVLDIKTTMGLRKIITTLAELSILELHPDNQKLGRTYIRLGAQTINLVKSSNQNSKKEVSTKVYQSKQKFIPPINKSLDSPINKSLDNKENTNIINYTNNHSEQQKKLSSQLSVKELLDDKLRLQINNIINTPNSKELKAIDMRALPLEYLNVVPDAMEAVIEPYEWAIAHVIHGKLQQEKYNSTPAGSFVNAGIIKEVKELYLPRMGFVDYNLNKQETKIEVEAVKEQESLSTMTLEERKARAEEILREMNN
jgi:hypothetical protein